MVVRKVLQYETYIVIGIFMVTLTLSKLLWGVKIDSDWFWFLAGAGLIIEGYIDLVKQKQFNKKYKVVSKKEFEEMWAKLENFQKKK